MIYNVSGGTLNLAESNAHGSVAIIALGGVMHYGTECLCLCVWSVR